MSASERGWLTCCQADAYVGLRHGTVRAAVARGELHGYVLGDSIRVSRDDLDDWVRSHDEAGEVSDGCRRIGRRAGL